MRKSRKNSEHRAAPSERRGAGARLLAFSVCAAVLVTAHSGRAADLAPASGDGIAVRINVDSGTGFLASSGEGVVFTDPEGTAFMLLGDSDIDNAYGTYTWTKTGEDTVDFTLNDQVSGTTVTYVVDFATLDTGDFSASAPGIGTQSGTFVFHHILKPTTVSEALAAGRPVARVDEGTVEVEFQIQRSDDLNTWTDATGSVNSDGSGSLTFSTPVDSDAAFFRVDILDTR